MHTHTHMHMHMHMHIHVPIYSSYIAGTKPLLNAYGLSAVLVTMYLDVNIRPLQVWSWENDRYEFSTEKEADGAGVELAQHLLNVSNRMSRFYHLSGLHAHMFT
jgi:hypothetical protein